MHFILFNFHLFLTIFGFRFPLDGILGMGFNDISIPPFMPTVFDEMVNHSLIDKPIFSVFLSNSHNGSADSVMLFGGIDEKYYQGPLTYYPAPLEAFWMIGIKHISVAGKIVHNCPAGVCAAVLDTGTSIIAGPNNVIAPLIVAIGPVFANCSNIKSLPPISFQIGAEAYTITSDIYVINDPTDGCTLGIEGLPAIEAPFWILGDPFLRAFYTVYDRAGKFARVGIAQARSQL